ncbi:MAG: Sec-independent protein translocase protein TatB [Marinobacterium sp.]|nr:Sec-independent protein translocase protein TatB [Marinobacterium sp.]
MFDIGFAELLIVAVVALIVLGPEKLPVAARTLGLWLGRIRRTVSSIQSEISEELRIEEMKRTAAISKEKLDQELEDMRTPFTESLNGEPPMSYGAGDTAPADQQTPVQYHTEQKRADHKMAEPSADHVAVKKKQDNG